ncbi:hypothetical protein GOV10_04505 [Candidatus Woesearchaeota archaeon]|nr:hypothetical protein [Candidatus Woesearchaeota archaeon]
MTNVVIHVGKDSRGKHFALRTFENMEINSSFMNDKIFTVKQKLDESLEDFYTRTKEEARKHGIDHVERLD